MTRNIRVGKRLLPAPLCGRSLKPKPRSTNCSAGVGVPKPKRGRWLIDITEYTPQGKGDTRILPPRMPYSVFHVPPLSAASAVTFVNRIVSDDDVHPDGNRGPT